MISTITGIAESALLAEASTALLGELSRDRGLTIAQAASFLRQHRVIRHCPYSPSTKWGKEWSVQVAKASLKLLVELKQAVTAIGSGQRKEETTNYYLT